MLRAVPRAPAVLIRVLGPLTVVDAEGRPIDVGSPRHREVLAALVVDAGRVVPTEALLERVWGDGARGATSANLHAVMSRLRGRLRVGAGAVEIATASPGYRLDAAPDAIDATTFQDLVARARAAAAAGEPVEARTLVREALDLWHGTAYADIHHPFAEAEAARLDGHRLAAHELAAELDLRLGDHVLAVDTLTALVAEHPLRETFRGQLMTALYRSGRQADALATYAEVREVLADELGLDPGPDLQSLHQRILEQDAELLAGGPRPSPPAVPAPRAEPRPTGLVAPLTGLLGREREVEYVRALVEESAQRLVTLTGVGGVGKTRLAYAVAEAAAGSFPDGVAVVHLAALTDPGAVLPAVGRATGTPPAEGLDPFAAVAEHLRPRRVLVVLDNAEHLVEVGPQVAQLVASCPRLTVLVTSRTSLRVGGESQYQVSPLPLPVRRGTEPEVVGAAAAVALFVERARGVSPAFALDRGNAEDVAAICRRLAGIPLAIELAAARTRLLSPAAIHARLDEVMAGSGARDLPPRQRTMRATIDWSYQLLEPRERRLFRRLSVCSDGFTLEAAQAVAGSPESVLPLLESLVEQSLVVPDLDQGATPRFRLLEPVLQHARSLLEPDEARDARDAHLAYFLALAEVTEPSYRGPGTIEALALTEREYANLVAAVEWGVAAGRADQAGWLCWALWLYWWLRSDLPEGRRLLESVLAQEVSDPVRVRATAALGAMTFAQGDLAAASCWADGAALGAATGDLQGQAHCVAGVGLVALAREDLATAEQAFRETIPLCERTGVARQWLWTLAHVWLGTVRVLRGAPEEALPLLTLALAAGREREDRLAIYIALFTSAQVSLMLGDPATARTQLEEGILLSRDTGDLANLAYFLDALSVVEAIQGRHPRVPVLHGSAQRLRELVGAKVYGYYKPDEALLADSLAGSRAALGAEAYDAAVSGGRRLTVDDVVAYATSGA